MRGTLVLDKYDEPTEGTDIFVIIDQLDAATDSNFLTLTPAEARARFQALLDAMPGEGA